MTSIIDEFKVCSTIPESIKVDIKLFHVFESELALCVTNEDKVYAFGDKFLIEKFTGYEERNINAYVLINELCTQNIEKFIFLNRRTRYCNLFARSSDNKIFSSGSNEFGQLVRGYKSDRDQSLRPMKIEFFDNKNIIDIASNLGCCLALSSEGLVYGWGDCSRWECCSLFCLRNKIDSNRLLTPVMIDNEFGVEKCIKQIHCGEWTSFLVTVDGFVLILNPFQCDLKNTLLNLIDVHKIYSNYSNYSTFEEGYVILKNDGLIEIISGKERKTIQTTFENFINSHYYPNNIDSQLIIDNNKGIQIINIKDEPFSEFNDNNAFEYCLFQYQSTFTTIHLKKNNLYYKNIEFNENKNSSFESLKSIEFDVEEYGNKYHNPNDSQNLNQFRILNPLPEILNSSVKYYHQIGKIDSENYSAIFVMNDNKVYAFGYNYSGVLGLGHNRNVKKFTLIPELCDQNIEEFFEGEFGYFMFGRNNVNQIFSWGQNHGGQLANENLKRCYYEFPKPKRIEFFKNKNIIHISCGRSHCLGLTEDGSIYGWGLYSYGQAGSRNEVFYFYVPISVVLEDSLEIQIKFIHSCGDTSCAVTVDGRAFIWGQINREKHFIPILIETNLSKMYLNSDKYCSILKMNGDFQLRKYNKLASHLKINAEGEKIDIFDTKTILKENTVYEVNKGNKTITKTNYHNFYEYFLYEKKEIKETIQITSDGYLMRQKIEMNLKPFSKLLKKTFVNIFERKYENDFDIFERIGEGGYGVVNKVKNKSSNGIFAIKRIQIKGNFSETLKEIRIMAEMKSEYVVKYHNSWTEAKVIDNNLENFVYIQMELCSQNLKNIIDLINTFDERYKTIKYYIRCNLLVEIIQCINYLHSSKPPILHRDLKPQNILITNGINGRSLKLCDFGLTSIAKENSQKIIDMSDEENENQEHRLARCNRVLKLCDFGLSKHYENSQNTRGVGTLRYMAPEVKDEDNDDSDDESDKCRYNLKSDIYSLGVVAKELFDLNESIKSIRKLQFLDKYSNYFSSLYLNENFAKILKNIAIMLSKRPEERLSCSELLDKTHEWTVDTNTIRSDENYEDFISVTKDNKELKILKPFLINITN